MLLLLFILLTLFFYGYFHEDARFEKFANRFFISELSSNPITLHYSLVDASKYGIDEAALTLPIYEQGQLLQDLEEIDKTISALKKFHPKRMSPSNRYTYVVLSAYLEALRECSSYLYFNEPLSSASGIQSELPILLAEYRLASPADIEKYFSILSQIPSYLDGIILYEHEKSEQGLFMSDSCADKVIEQCMMLMNPRELEEGEHFLEITFNERLDKLSSQNLIDADEAAAYQAENERLLTTLVSPAYDRLADELTLLKGSGHDTCGLANYKDGQKYYQAYLRLTTGSYHNIEDIKKMLSYDFKENYTELISLLKKYPLLGDSSIFEENTFPPLDTKDMLLELQGMIKDDYPAIPYDGGDAAGCTVKYVNDSLAPYAAPAFYMTPPLDDLSENIVYINSLETEGGLSLFTTLAHEAYPGHLYQTVYSQRHMQEQNRINLSNVLYFGGYIEGWAVYAELNSYDYAIRLAKESHPETEYVYMADKLNRQIQLCIYSLLDIMIHYEGASYEKVCEILNALGFSNEAGILAVYEYIAEEPCNYLKYYLGYLEIMELKKYAKDLWQDSYTPKRFHAFILDNGPTDYRTLEKLIKITKYNFR